MDRNLQKSKLMYGLIAAWLVLVGSDAFRAEPAVADSGDRSQLTIDPNYFVDDVPTWSGQPSTADADNRAGAKGDNGQGPDRVSVLVHMQPNLGRGAVQRAAVRAFAGKQGGVVRYEYKVVLPNVLNLRGIPRLQLAALKRMPGVDKVEIDEYHPNVVRLTKSTPLIRGLQSQITGAGLSADGSGVRVCVCDTGIDMDHVMYADRIDAAASWDFVNNDSNPDDDHGHGSHVSGIAVGGAGLQIDLGCGTVPFQGVAPNATLIGAKILNSAGGGTDSDIIAGIDHCADQSPSGGRADVINLSIGTGNYAGICTHSWAVAANNAVANGVVVVAASGNECNTNSMGSPACGEDVIAVGATYKDDYPNCEDSTSSFNWCGSPQTGISVDDIVDFSNQSDYLDVAAPGSVIWSASNAAGGSSVTGMSGTSMSSPHVAGLAALILDADPTLTPAEVRQVIRDGAIDMGPPGFDRGYGYGRIDVINSLSLLAPCTGDPDCDDGLWCNGAETCSGGACLAGSDPCPGQSCDEATDSCVAAPTLQLEWTMDTNPGWSTQGLWAWGQPTGGGGQHGSPDPTSGATGSNVFGYNLSGDYENNLPETHLTTTAIDCSNYANVSVKFQRWLGVEQPAYDHAYFRVSTNGSTWTTLWQNSAEVADTSWSQQTFDISSIADGQSTVYLRWTLGTTDGSWQYCGWNIDDVEIWASSTGGGCTVNADCDDGLFCNGAETCVGGACQAGTAPNCNDGVSCTDDSCNESTDSCDNVVNDANCDDGLWCNGTETCDAAFDCQTGTAPNCNDGVSCTDDSCNEATDSCNNIANDANCDDGTWCNGTETCHATLGCQAGTAPNCNDGVGCTDDSCNEATDSCDNITNNANCDDGVFCNGAETCDAALDCQAGSDPCPGQLCDEGGSTCVDCFTNGDCDDGLFCNGAETCAAGSCQAGSDPCPGQSCNESTDECQSVECIDAGDCDDGSACTVDSCVNNVCVHDCAGSVSSYPYGEDFEGGLGAWSNVGGDVFDWTRDSGGTPSSNTGPSGDHTTGSGFYMYAEMSSPRVAGDTAIFEGPCLDLTGTSSVDFSFWYHMYGGSVGTLDVEVSDDCTTWTNVWSLSGNQGNAWYEAVLNLDAYAGSTIKVRFIATRGSSWDGDIAIDDIGVDASGSPCLSDPECDDGDACTTDACVASVCQNVPIDCDDGNGCTTDTCSGGVCSNTCPALVSSYPDSEDYEAGFGDWSNVSGDDFDWARNSGGTPSSGTGPSGDHTTGSGFYMYVEASSPNYPSQTTILEGPCVDLTGSSSASLTFWYHMLGSAVGTLYLEVSDDCSVWSPAWSLAGDQGSAWQQVIVDLSAWSGSIVTLRFRGVTGSSWQGDMCIDDLVIDAGGAPECVVPADCDDGNVCTDDDCVGGVCQYANNTSPCDDGLFCNGSSDVCEAGGCVPETNSGVANGTFDGGASWTSHTAGGGSITFPGNLNVVGPNAGSAAFAWADQSGVTVDGANLEFDLLSYSSSDTGAWDYPVFYLDGTYYGLNLNGTLGAPTTGGTGGAGTIDNGSQVSATIHYVVDIDALTGNAGPHTVGFGVHSADGAYGAGTAVYDNVLPAGGPVDPCPGQTCDEVNDVCVP